MFTKEPVPKEQKEQLFTKEPVPKEQKEHVIAHRRHGDPLGEIQHPNAQNSL